MKSISQITIAVAVAAGLTLGAVATGAAQGKSPASQTPRARHMSAAAKRSESFPKGITTKLGTTPEAMETAYLAAKQTNPRLTRGQFIAANLVAQNLGAKNSAVTTDALLSGLQNKKSIGQTLQSLGVSSKDAHDAQRQAARDARDADRAEDNAEKPKP